MGRLNTLKAIENAKGKINYNYDMTIDDIMTIDETSNGKIDLICKCFTFGYVQGAKAQKKGCAFNG